MVRTLEPTATTVAQIRRLDTWAVAGMRIPPDERRSPSLVGICTSRRSLSILIGRAGPPGRGASAFVTTGRRYRLRGMPIEPVFIDTVDGVVLEAEVSLVADAMACVVLAHPHPQFGGDMHSLVTDALFHSLPGLGVSALRFNFRGVGRSGGVHDEGRGERLDVAAAVDTM